MDEQQSRPLVRVQGVSVSYNGRNALNNINFEVWQGGHTALTGSNGAGKSTLLALLRGEQYPDQAPDGTSMGKVCWYPPMQNGIIKEETAPLSGRGMTSLLSPAIQEKFTRRPWHITGEEAVMAGLFDDFLLYSDTTSEQMNFCRKLAADLGAGHLLERTVSTYSQGEMRLVLLVRALIRKPALLLLDEAVDGLDAKNRKLFLSGLEALPQAAGSTVLLSTHRPEYLPGFIKRRLHMRKGSFVSVPTPGKRATQTSQPLANSIPPKADGPRIILDNASVYINHCKVLHSINWSILPGQNWLILGENGAGKSTLLRLLTGAENAALGGSIRRFLPGQGQEEMVELARIQRGIHCVSDQLQTNYYDIPALDVVFSGLDASVGVYRQAKPSELTAARELMRETGVENLVARTLRSLSTGQARRVLLARALMGRPDLLLLDEPFSGLDPEGRAGLAELIEQRVAMGLQIVLVSHYAEDKLPCITHTACLQKGKLSMHGAGGSDLPA